MKFSDNLFVIKHSPNFKPDNFLGNQDFVKVDYSSILMSESNPHFLEISKSPSVKNIRELEHPKTIWKQDYKYLGDHPINEDIKFDLRLINKSQWHYHIVEQLPEGLNFINGVLEGKSKDETKIRNLTVIATSPDKTQTLQQRFQIRFYEKVCSSKSFLHNDFLKLGYGNQMIDYGRDLIFYRNFDPPQLNRKLGTPIEEASIAAKLIGERAGNKDINLLISGGIDSQCMIQSFLKGNVDFNAVIAVDVNGVNKDDLEYARLVAKKYQIKLKEIPFDYLKYIRNYDYLNSSLSYRFNNPEYGIILSFMDLFEGFPVYAGRPISVSKDKSGTKRVIGLAVDETWSRARFLEREGRDGCPEFLIHTPELISSFLKTEFSQSFPTGAQWNYPEKLKLLESGGFDTSLAPPVKFTGFERLHDQFDSDDFGNKLWVEHRGPLKLRFPNPSYRNAVKIEQNDIGDPNDVILKPYPDGFGFNYVKNIGVENFH